MGKIQRGDFYEDCRYHPMLCISADYYEDQLVGISLVTGTPVAVAHGTAKSCL